MRFATLACLLSLTIMSGSAWPQGSPIHSLPEGAVEKAAIVAPNIGWAFGQPTTAGSVLWWTTDGGAHWKRITPPMSERELIISVFFLNTQVGWALLEDVSKGPDSFQFDLASTTSAGAKWELHHLSIPGLSTEGMRWGYITGWIDFSDLLHGWMYLRPELPDLLITSDGGRSWQPAQSSELPTWGESIVRVKPEVAWLTDTVAHWLYVTRDGAKTWQHLSIPAPTQLSGWLPKDNVQMYTDPVFQDPEHGFEVVTYASSKSGILTNVVLFETHDGGITWQAQGLLGDLRANMSSPISSTVVDSTWLIARRPFLALPMVTILHPGEWDNGLIHNEAGYDSHLQMSFANPDRGWVLMDGALLATEDDGASWTDVTPDRDERKPKPGRLPGAQ
jgi:photosystem II stability/assembly factor-like uncharacterized protein